ncbi:MAG TPA: hypothetical protein VFQ32_08395, partial [Ktedonobacterales bacterium]|nr:hypothetical protein [Ktedonobacterales bacterium]
MLVIKSGLIARSRGAGGTVNPLRIAAGLSGSLPPSSLLVFGMITVQLGAALAKDLFSSLGPAGVVFLRVGFAALTLLVIWRPWRLRASGAQGGQRAGVLAGAGRRDSLAVVAFGLILAVMNLTFYAALDRIPLGVTVTIEFIGPLSVAVAG